MDERETRIAHNLGLVRNRIDEALERAHRPPGSARLIAVTKTVGVEEIAIAARLGVTMIGENRVPDALDKMAKTDVSVEWHMIGSLQRRKVRDTIGRFDLIHSVDRIELAEEIQKRAAAADVVTPVLIEVNTSGETAKHGVTAGQAPDLAEQIARLDRVHVRGLMTMAPFVADPEEARPCFTRLRECAERIKSMSIPGVDMDELSMGMSNDYEVAIEEGATMVRIGTAIFGPRQQ
jgi:pyridoxal phosphate enzyme (YggS family)